MNVLRMRYDWGWRKPSRKQAELLPLVLRGLTMSEMARRVGATAQAVHLRLAVLERKGLIITEPWKTKARRVRWCGDVMTPEKCVRCEREHFYFGPLGCAKAAP